MWKRNKDEGIKLGETIDEYFAETYGEKIKNLKIGEEFRHSPFFGGDVFFLDFECVFN